MVPASDSPLLKSFDGSAAHERNLSNPRCLVNRSPKVRSLSLLQMITSNWTDGDRSLICLRRHYLAVFGSSMDLWF
jgi:hypothetical protein